MSAESDFANESTECENPLENSQSTDPGNSGDSCKKTDKQKSDDNILEKIIL